MHIENRNNIFHEPRAIFFVEEVSHKPAPEHGAKPESKLSGPSHENTGGRVKKALATVRRRFGSDKDNANAKQHGVRMELSQLSSEGDKPLEESIVGPKTRQDFLGEEPPSKGVKENVLGMFGLSDRDWVARSKYEGWVKEHGTLEQKLEVEAQIKRDNAIKDTLGNVFDPRKVLGNVPGDVRTFFEMIKKELSGEDISMQEMRERFGIKSLGEQTQEIREANKALKAAKGKDFEPIKKRLALERKNIGDQRKKLGQMFKDLTGEAYHEASPNDSQEKGEPEDVKVKVLRTRLDGLSRRNNEINNLLGPQEEVSHKDTIIPVSAEQV